MIESRSLIVWLGCGEEYSRQDAVDWREGEFNYFNCSYAN